MKGNLKKAIAILIAFLLCMGSVSWNTFITEAASLASKKPDVGVGTVDSPYEINEASELLWFAESVNAKNSTINAVLTADIDMNPGYTFAEDGTYISDDAAEELLTWTPIGDWELCSGYDGVFDGRGHSIRGLYLVDSSKNYVGLFGRLNTGGEISNVNIANSYMEGYMAIGGICGDARGVLRNCDNEATVKGYMGVGGICGYSGGAIQYCYNKGSILVGPNGYRRGFGGICGIHNGGTLSNCVNAGNVTGYDDIGGICGLAWGEVVIENSYNVGENSGASRIGGIAAEPYDSLCTLTVRNCYNAGKISGQSYMGEVIGLNGTAYNCFYLAESEIDSIAGTTYKTTEQFASGEVAYLLQSAQIETEIVWGQLIGEEGYPVLEGVQVYNVENCSGGQYSNVNESKAHNSIDHACVVCGRRGAKQPDVGVGTEDSPYEIDEALELLWFAESVNSGNTAINAVLTANIDMNPGYAFAEDGTYTTSENVEQLVVWTPIGNSSNQFSGSFDGRGYVISGLYVNDSTMDYIGLFGACNSATISNVGVKDNYFCGFSNVGGICGSGASEISNCYHSGIVIGELMVGGIAGISGAIIDCYNTGYVKGGAQIGGIAGTYAQVDNCYNTGNIVGQNEVGGITGQGGVVSCSYNSGKVTGSQVTGGISGQVKSISNCYNIGTISGGGAIGGIGGFTNSTSAIIDSCFNIGEVNGTSDTGMILGAMWNGRLENNYYMASGETDSLEGTWYKTSEQFASGEVAYLLQSAQTETDIVWGQLIGKETYPVLEGVKVYNVENCSGGQYSNVNEIKAHNLDEGICVLCGKGEDVILSGYTLSLTGNIAVNFYMQLSNVVLNDDSAYILFTFADGETSEVKVSDAEIKTDGSKTYYVFTCEVQAPEINDEFTTQVITTACETTSYTYSAKKYADYILNNTDADEEYEKAAPIVKAMLNYGGYSQKQFGHNTNALANAGLYGASEDPVLVGAVPSLSEYAFTAPNKNVGVKYYGTSLLLNSETTIRHYFTFTEGEHITEIREKYEFKLADGTLLAPVMRGGMIYIDIRNINAADLDVKYEVTVTNKMTSETFTFSYSALSYAKYVLDYALAGTNLVNVIKAMYFYNEAANAYFQ